MSIPLSRSRLKALLLQCADVKLTNEEFKALDSELDKHKVYGHRGLGGF